MVLVELRFGLDRVGFELLVVVGLQGLSDLWSQCADLVESVLPSLSEPPRKVRESGSRGSSACRRCRPSVSD